MRFSPAALFLLIIFAAATGKAQAQNSDFQTWNSIGVEKALSSTLKLSLSEEVRLKDNVTSFSTSFTDAGVTFKLMKNLQLGLFFRFIIKPASIAYRPYAEISYKLKTNSFIIEPRLRYQHQVEQNETAKNYLRPKVTASYKINKHWEPYVSGEWFYHMLYYKGNEFDEYRLSAGTGYDFDSPHSLKVFYLLDQEFNVEAAEQNHVVGASYEYDF